jgi:CRISPR-associated endonuclease/helicase Cas3
MTYYSRSANVYGEKEEVKGHLARVAELSKKYASEFGAGPAGEWVGVMHDAGKVSTRFQEVLDGKRIGVNHECAGAFLLWMQSAKKSIDIQKGYQLMARVVYGHHKGLQHDIKDTLVESYLKTGAVIEQRAIGRTYAVSGKAEYDNVVKYLRENVSMPQTVYRYSQNSNCNKYNNIPEMLLTRMLLSSLVDADYIAAGEHQNINIETETTGAELNTKRLIESIECYKQKLIAKSTSDVKLNAIREQVYQACIDGAKNEPGMYKLTAPTGTGKTLSLLAYAAKHADIWNKRRIIIVLPYVSIIDQNVKVYKEIYGDVLQISSDVNNTVIENGYAKRWSAPIIVTTTVGFFEGLYHAGASNVRWLHNICNSVIVFDESQVLNPDLLGSSYEALRLLTEQYGCSVLLSTATQPAIEYRRDIAIKPKEINVNIAELYKQTKRVEVTWDIESKTALEDIAKELQQLNQVCCVLNKKAHVHTIYNLLKVQGKAKNLYELTTDMCKAHRDETLNAIRAHLKNGESCTVITTSCIEAGVDIDFEYLYTAMAPLDSIIQRAGRCNRNGCYKTGKVKVFIPKSSDGKSIYPSAIYAAESNIVLRMHRNAKIKNSTIIDINDPEVIKHYYQELYRQIGVDKQSLQDAISDYDYEKVEKEYKLIEKDDVRLVLVPYEKEISKYKALVEDAEYNGITARWLKRAAKLLVNSYECAVVESKCKGVEWRNGTESVTKIYICPIDKYYSTAQGLNFAETETN